MSRGGKAHIFDCSIWGKSDAYDRVHHAAQVDDLLHTSPHSIHGDGKPDSRVGACAGICCS